MDHKVTHEVELNFYYLHYNDAKKFIEFAESEKTKLKSLYARHAILSMVFASEALINRVLSDFYIPQECNQIIEKLNISEKWCLAPLVCIKKDSMVTFDKSTNPFQSFAELIKMRNWLVHPRSGNFVNATTEGEEITILDTNETVPWIETVRGKFWPQTGMPINPFELTEVHAKLAMDILDKMINRLKEMLSPKISDTWLKEVDFIKKDKTDSQKLTIDSLWGGYTPD